MSIVDVISTALYAIYTSVHLHTCVHLHVSAHPRRLSLYCFIKTLLAPQFTKLLPRPCHSLVHPSSSTAVAWPTFQPPTTAVVMMLDEDRQGRHTGVGEEGISSIIIQHNLCSQSYLNTISEANCINAVSLCWQLHTAAACGQACVCVCGYNPNIQRHTRQEGRKNRSKVRPNSSIKRAGFYWHDSNQSPVTS